jgi:hypothetical protein
MTSHPEFPIRVNTEHRRRGSCGLGLVLSFGAGFSARTGVMRLRQATQPDRDL